VQCDDPPPHRLPDDASEAAAGYDDELAALDLTAVPAVIDTTPLRALKRALVAYMLEDPTLTSIDRDAALAHPLGRAVLGAYALDPTFDLPFLRRGLFRYYACARGQPLALADALLGVTLDGDPEIVDPSAPKAGPRRLTHGVRADGTDVFVAETLVDGAVRETEVLIHGHRGDGAIDFFAWDAQGRAVRSSLFATSTGNNVDGPAPFACMACHRDADSGTFTVLRPSL
jgi:hypothetical protein